MTTEALPALKQLIWIPLICLLPHLVIVTTASFIASKGRDCLRPGMGLALYSYLLGTVVLAYSGSLMLLHAVVFYLPVFTFRAWLHYRDTRQAIPLAAFSALASIVAWQILFPALLHWEG